jgi:hypothetical protein
MVNIALTENALKIISRFTNGLSAESVGQLVNDSYEYACKNDLYVRDAAEEYDVFSLLRPSTRGESMFVMLHLMEEQPKAFRILFRAEYTRPNPDIWTDDFFRQFPDLKNNIEKYFDVKNVGWTFSETDGSTPGSLSENSVRIAVEGAHGNYRERLYHPKAYGFGDTYWIDYMTQHLIHCYQEERSAGRVGCIKEGMYFCKSDVFNENGEDVYMLVDEEGAIDLLMAEGIVTQYPEMRKQLLDAMTLYREDDNRRRSHLLDWAFIHFDEFLDLYPSLLPERWQYDEKGDEKSLSITIMRYIANTFLRLLWEEKVYFFSGHRSVATNLEDAKFAAFNTGLVNKQFQEIHAVFRKNEIADKQPWSLDEFTAYGKGLTKLFPFSPARASYFAELTDTFYDFSVANARDPEIDIDHVLIDNLERLPDAVKRVYLGEDYEKYISATPWDKRAVRDERPPNSKNALMTMFRSAIKKALVMAETNYRICMPIYYLAEGEMQIILPVALENEYFIMAHPEKESPKFTPDIALAMKLTDSGYCAKTVLTMKMAYMDSRLVMRHEESWIMAT